MREKMGHGNGEQGEVCDGSAFDSVWTSIYVFSDSDQRNPDCYVE